MPPRRSKPPRIEIPQEIRTLITDYCDNDLTTLTSITLTDKGWSQRARELLFKHVYIGEPKPKLRCKSLVKLVQKRPDLLRKAETLTLTEATTWKPKELATEGRIKSSKDLLITILPHFASLRGIALEGRGGKSNLDWDLIPGQVKLQLCTLFAIPQLKSIAFNKVSNLQNVIALLSGYQHLERLSLMSSDTVQQPIWERPKIPGQCPASFPLDRRPVFMTDVTARPPNLRVFEYRNATFAWELLIEASLQRRANLSISDHPEQTRRPLNIKELWVQDIIPLPKDSISNPTASLERLHLTLNEGLFHPFDIAEVPRLTALSVHVTSPERDLDERSGGHLEASIELMSKQNTSPLEELTLYIDMRNPPKSFSAPAMDRLRTLETSWYIPRLLENLRKILINKDKLPSFRRFDVEVLVMRGEVMHDHSWASLRKNMQDCLPSQDSRGCKIEIHWKR